MSEVKSDALARAGELLEAGDFEAFLEAVDPLHPADVADLLEGMDNAAKVRLLKHLGNEKAAEVLAIVDEQSGQALLHLFSDTEVVSLLGEMPSDDAADIIGAMPPEKSRQIGALLPTDERERLSELLEFDEESAGGIMESETVAVRDDANVADAIELVRRNADEIEHLQNVYVVDRAKRLVGTVRILDLLRYAPSRPVREIMDENVISVPVGLDQEDVAGLFGKYDEFTLPVVDDEDKLVGRITVDDIIDVMEEEASEDMARMVGTDEDEIGETSPLKVSRARLPWLVVAMLGQVLNAFIMSHYEASIETLVTLAFFIPLVIGTAGGTGIQAAVVVVREIAVGQVSATRIGRRVLRELTVTFINGLVLGVILVTAITVWQRDTGLGLLLFSSLVAVTCVAAVLGALVPLLMKRAGIDPAIATGPLITVSCDILGLLIYLTIATYYISIIGS